MIIWLFPISNTEDTVQLYSPLLIVNAGKVAVNNSMVGGEVQGSQVRSHSSVWEEKQACTNQMKSYKFTQYMWQTKLVILSTPLLVWGKYINLYSKMQNSTDVMYRTRLGPETVHFTKSAYDNSSYLKSCSVIKLLIQYFYITCINVFHFTGIITGEALQNLHSKSHSSNLI